MSWLDWVFNEILVCRQTLFCAGQIISLSPDFAIFLLDLFSLIWLLKFLICICLLISFSTVTSAFPPHSNPLIFDLWPMSVALFEPNPSFRNVKTKCSVGDLFECEIGLDNWTCLWQVDTLNGYQWCMVFWIQNRVRKPFGLISHVIWNTDEEMYNLACLTMLDP